MLCTPNARWFTEDPKGLVGRGRATAELGPLVPWPTNFIQEDLKSSQGSLEVRVQRSHCWDEGHWPCWTKQTELRKRGDVTTWKGGLVAAVPSKCESMNEETPNPGTKEALDLGCKCPVIDNGYGKGYLGSDTFIFNMDCEVHNDE